MNPDIFESDDVANSCPVSYRTINQYGSATATTGQICRHYEGLCGGCSEHILLQRRPGYYSESGYHQMRVDRRIRFKYATCGQGNFWIRKEKVVESKISGYVLNFYNSIIHMGFCTCFDNMVKSLMFCIVLQELCPSQSPISFPGPFLFRPALKIGKRPWERGLSKPACMIWSSNTGSVWERLPLSDVETFAADCAQWFKLFSSCQCVSYKYDKLSLGNLRFSKLAYLFKNIKFPRGNCQPIVPRQKHSIV